MKDEKEKYDVTYHFGETTVHIVAPPPMTKKEIEKVLDEYHKAGWEIIKEWREEREKHIEKKD